MKATDQQSRKFAAYLNQKNDYRYFVGISEKGNRRWIEVRLDGGELIGPDFERFPVGQLESWLVVYPTIGETVDGENVFYPLPPGVTGIQVAQSTVIPSFTDDELSRGLRRVEVRYGPSPTHPENTRYYSTTLMNMGAESVRCLGFGAYTLGISRKLWTVTGAPYSSSQFEEWYAVPRGGWIAPAESVCDPSNYGSGGIWVYYFETRSGERFHTGKIIPGSSHISKFIAGLKARLKR